MTADDFLDGAEPARLMSYGPIQGEFHDATNIWTRRERATAR